MVRTLIAAAVALPWVLWAIVRVSGIALPYPVAPALAFTPYAALTVVAPIVVALVLRCRVIAAVALGAGIALAVCVVPRATGDPAAAGGKPALTVMSVNSLQGRADAQTVMRLVETHDVDVLAIEESRPAFVARLDAFGARSRLPYRSARPADEALLSARPLRATGRPAEGDLRLRGGRVVRLRTVHTVPPISRGAWRAWRDELTALPGTGGAGIRRVYAGDFNATLDHPELRDVLSRGYRDAADVTGDGWRTTWPAGRRMPPEITIDHVLADRRIGIASFSVHGVPHTDHRAVIARLVVP